MYCRKGIVFETVIQILVADAKSKFDEVGKLTDETTRGLIIQQLLALKESILKGSNE